MSGQTGVNLDYTYMQDQDPSEFPTSTRMNENRPYYGFMDTGQSSNRQHVFSTVSSDYYPSYPPYNTASYPFGNMGSTEDALRHDYKKDLSAFEIQRHLEPSFDQPTAFDIDNRSKVKTEFVYSNPNDLPVNCNTNSSAENTGLTYNYTFKDSNGRPPSEFNNSLAKTLEESSNGGENTESVQHSEQMETVRGDTNENKDANGTLSNEERDSSAEPSFIKVEPLQNNEETPLSRESSNEPMIVNIKQEIIDEDEEDSKKAESEQELNASGDDDSEDSYDEMEDDEEEENSEEELQKPKKKKKTPRKNIRIKLSPNQSKKKEYKCDICSKVVMTKRALEKHVNLHTGKYSCSTCGKHCNSQASLDNHEKVHAGYVGNEMCKVCDKTFYDKSSLNKHTLSVHMGIKHFQCEYCEKSFYAKKTYQEHVRVHTGEKPFKCELCPKAYKRISDLNHHIRLHKGEISVTCELCGEGYRRGSELKRHMQKHATMQAPVKPEPTNKCDWCELKFSTKKALRQHMPVHMENMDSIDIMNKMVTPRQQPDQFTSDKLKLVNNIVLGLGSGGLGQSLGMPNDDSSVIRDNLTESDENAIRMSLFGFSSFGSPTETPLQPVATGSPCYLAGDMQPSIEKSPTVNDNVASTVKDTNKVGKESNQKSETINDDKNCDDDEEFDNDFQDDVDDDFEPDENIEQDSADLNSSSSFTTDNSPSLAACSPKSPRLTKLKNSSSLTTPKASSQKAPRKRKSASKNASSSKTTSFDPKLVVVKQEKFDIEIEHVADHSVQVEAADYAAADVCDDYGGDTEVEASDDNDPEYMPEDIKTPKVKVKPLKKRKLKVSQNGSGNKTKKQKPNVEEGEKPVKKRGGKKKGKGEGEDDNGEENGPGGFVCEECGKHIASKSHFKKHMNLHTGEFFCAPCNKTFTSSATLGLHMAKHEGRYENTAKCKVCDKTFYDVSSLNKHVKNVHMNNRPFACTECDRKFSERKTLVEHMRVHTGERPFQCQICGRTFKRQGELNFHMRKHTGDTKFTCSKCGEGFRRHSELKTHMIVKHDGERPFGCSLCGKGFMSNCLLQEHLLTHAEKSFECNKCGKGFHSRSKLAKHLQIKTDCEKLPVRVNGLYKCKHCLREYLELKEYNDHVRSVHPIESGKRQYLCQVCHKEFNRSQSLNRHMKIHTQRRDFKCTTCSAAFIQKHHLSQHMFTHTGEKPYPCKICNRSFAQKATLYSHMKHH